MPRKSAAELATERWRPKAAHPKAPQGLNPQARRLWDEIVLSRPANFFLPGAQSLLRTYVVVSVELEKLGPRLSDDDNGKVLRRVAILGTLQSTLAQKLRLSVQSSLRIDNARVLERSQPPAAKPWLLDGKAPWDRGKKPN
jgi:hypothetical protein